MPARGDLAPDFTLPFDDGSDVTLSQLKGGPVVIFFYPKDDTSGCTAEAIAFSELASAFNLAAARVIGISPDSARSHVKFKKKHGLSVALGADEEKAVAQAYGVWVEKSMYGRKYMGIERSTFLIDEKGRVAEAWRKVKVPGHAADVLKAVRALTGKS